MFWFLIIGKQNCIVILEIEHLERSLRIIMLFLKECKKTICSLTFVLYAFTIFAMYGSQFTTELDSPIRQPSPNDSYYGSVVKEVPEVLMPAAVESLISEYLAGSYTAYPFMFIKVVRLKESDTVQIAEIIEELTDISRSELNQFTEYEPGGYYGDTDENGNMMMVYKEAVLPEYHLSKDITYTHFKELMAQADEIIGKGSKYGEKYLVSNFSQVPMTYEDALAEYEEMMDEQNIAKAYMRLYCDYLGIDLAIMPVFVCVGLWQMDKRSRMEQLIYSRKVSSAKLIITRYLALVGCMVVPVALTFIHAMIGLHNLYPEKNIYFGEAAGLVIMWLLPSIMIVVSVGALITELLSPFWAIFLQGVWWYAALGTNELTGSITKYTLVIRHNTLGETRLFRQQFRDFVWNRTGYFILSLLLVGLVIFVYEKTRKGNYDGKRNIWKNNWRKFKV